MVNKKVVVIGAGFGGLAAAALLAKEGFKVSVVEKNDQPGGRARVWRKAGFVYDMGPSWYLMPEVFDKFFAEFGKTTQDYYRLIRLDPNYRVFFGGKETLDIPADREKIEKIFGQLEINGDRQLQKYMQSSEYQYRVAMRDFMYREYASWRDFFNWQLISEGLKLHIFESLDRFALRYFKDERIRKILEYPVVFLGGSPTNTPALYSIMSHVDFDLGVWYPSGGIGEVVKGYQKVAEEAGAEILLKQEVKKIAVKGKAAYEIITANGSFPADIVVVNADYHHAETELLAAEHQSYRSGYWEKRKMGPSAFILYLGLSKKIAGLKHHNLYLDPYWDEHFRSVFERPAWPQNFSYYISCPSKTDDTVAPAGGENLFILVPVAPGLEDSHEIREQYYRKTIRHLEELIGEKVEESVVVKRIYAHTDFKQDYHAYQGTALGLAHTLFQTAVFRPAHRSRKVDNLYYIGSYTHPGIGVPMVTISSQVVAREIKKHHG